MEQKEKQSNFGGIERLFKNGGLGLLISIGGFGTLLPNILQAIGEWSDVGSFPALQFFSIVYFVGPVLVITTYWLLKGYRSYFFEKLDVMGYPLSELSPEVRHDLRNESPWGRVFLFAVGTAKVIPIFIFALNKHIYTLNPGMIFIPIVLYPLVTCLEVGYVAYSSQSLWIKTLASDPFNQRDNTYAGSNQSKVITLITKMSVLIFSLDFFAGFALVTFVKPWITYHDNFYSGAQIAYGAVAAVLWLAAMANALTRRIKLDEGEVLSAAVIVSVIVWAVPGVNLKYIAYFSIHTLALLGGIAVVWRISNGHERDDATAWLLKSLALVLVAMFLFWSFLRPAFERFNAGYFSSRLEAAEVISTLKLSPLAVFDKRINPRLPADTVQVMKDIIQFNQEWSDRRLVGESFDTTKLKSKTKAASLDEIDRLLNLRRIFFYGYDSLIVRDASVDQQKTKEAHSHQAVLNAFYDTTYHKIQQKFFHDKLNPAVPFMDKDDKSHYVPMLEFYSHPINYYAYNFSYYRDEKNKAAKMHDLAVEINRIHRMANLLKSQSTQFTDPEIARHFELELKVLIRDSLYVKYYQQNFELSSFDPSKKLNTEKDYKQLLDFHKAYSIYMDEKYVEHYRNAQVIYRSFLADTQRNGVFMFVAFLLSAGLADYFNRKSWSRIMPANKERRDTPNDALTIMTISVFILLIPLISPIKPANIDPEHPYWMMNLQHWYLPSLGKQNADPETFDLPKHDSEDITKAIDRLDRTIKDLGNQPGKIDPFLDSKKLDAGAETINKSLQETKK